MNLILRTLEREDEAAFFRAQGSMDPREKENTLDWKGESFADFVELQRRNRRGESLPAGFVPYTNLYGFVGGELVGRLGIRHELNAFLAERGGHIGYVVVPPHRRRGYAGEMFRQALPICKSLGIERALITCDNGNEASWRIIEKHGAVLEKVMQRPQDKTPFRRYWLELGV